MLGGLCGVGVCSGGGCVAGAWEMMLFVGWIREPAGVTGARGGEEVYAVVCVVCGLVVCRGVVCVLLCSLRGMECSVCDVIVGPCGVQVG